MITRRSFQLAAILAAATFMAGCATAPTQDTMQAAVADFQLPKLPEDGKAIVYVVRPSGLGGLIRFNVFLDDQEDASEMGYTRSSQYIHFNVKPGNHKIYSKAENWAETLVDVKPGDIIFIQQDPGMGLIMARNSLQQIDAIPGKYHVKTLTVGTILKTDK